MLWVVAMIMMYEYEFKCYVIWRQDGSYVYLFLVLILQTYSNMDRNVHTHSYSLDYNETLYDSHYTQATQPQ